jgi:hypothetical protein
MGELCSHFRFSGRLGNTRARLALLAVPSVIIGEEDNVSINPAHPDCASITARKRRRFIYDHRI